MAGSVVLWNLFPPTGWSFWLQTSDEVAGERGGQMRTRQLGPDLWMAHYEANQLLPERARILKAYITEVMARRATIQVFDPRGQYPIDDPKGIKLTAPQNVLINSLNADNLRMSLKGLPANYVLSVGDYLSFDYGASAARALHQIWTTVTANASGVTPEFYVTPARRVGASVNDAVTLERPSAEMLIIPGSYIATEGPRFASIAFDAIQVLP